AEQALQIWSRYEDQLRAIFKSAKAGQKFGVSDKQGQAWILNELLDERQDTGQIHKNPGGRSLGIDPSSFEERVETAHKKLRPGGNLEKARALIDTARREMDRFSMTDQQYDQAIGPTPRGGHRSVKLSGTGTDPEIALRVGSGRGRRVHHDPGKDYHGRRRG